jgi:Transposase DDE domain group 1
VERIVGQIRAWWNGARIILRGDFGFCREELMAWCESHGVDSVLGFARNERVRRRITPQLRQVKLEHPRTGKAARVFTEFFCHTRAKWSQSRRVVAKVEHLAKGENPRFEVTSLGEKAWPARKLYEQLYCARAKWRTASRSN